MSWINVVFLNEYLASKDHTGAIFIQNVSAIFRPFRLLDFDHIFEVTHFDLLTIFENCLKGHIFEELRHKINDNKP